MSPALETEIPLKSSFAAPLITFNADHAAFDVEHFALFIEVPLRMGKIRAA
jgi:hypothetical protein